MKITKKGFIVKSKIEIEDDRNIINYKIIYNHLLPNEIHLLKRICMDSIDGECEIKETTFVTENDFISQKF